ncbi:DUF732 domain-containing protein, partial [Corynebacterium sp. CCM 8862]
ATAALVALTGCGDSATTTDEATATSIAPLPRESLSATATTPAGGDTDESVPAAAKVKKPADYGIEDQGAKEITAIPTFESSHTDSDRTYLKALTGAGITVDDIEDQLIGAGVEVCRTRAAGELDVTLPAVAGQLVEQQRTRLGAEETANAIASAAQAAYCRTP